MAQSLVLFLNVYKGGNILLIYILMKMSCTSYVVLFLSFFPPQFIALSYCTWISYDTRFIIYWKCVSTCVFFFFLKYAVVSSFI